MQTEIEIKLNRIICGKSEEKLKEFPNNFFDGIFTDPPYEMDFMNKKWDSTGIAYSIELWKEVLRVLKPGAYLLCFGGTRTHHRVTVSIEDAGFIIKDEIDWLYGEGFPKSTNISKQIDKEAGAERQKEWTEDAHGAAGGNLANRPWIDKAKEDGGHFIDKNISVTEKAKQWDGYGTGLKPAHEPIIVAMKPLESGLTYAQNAKKWGVAGLNIDGGRIGITSKVDKDEYIAKNTFNKTLGNKKPGFMVSKFNPDIKKTISQGRWPANIILSHSPDCVCVGTKIINEGAPEGGYTYNDREYQVEGFVKDCKPQAPSNRGQETIEVWACVPDCPIRIMDSQSGKSGDHGTKLRGDKVSQFSGEGMFSGGQKTDENVYSDSGGASRFFYCAKAKQSEKEAGLMDFVPCIKCGKFDSKTHIRNVDGKKIKEKCIRNNHPTVKPLSLMKYLINLIKMPSSKENKQVILDPFCGSGTTLIALEQMGINYIGIEQDFDNVLISTARIGV